MNKPNLTSTADNLDKVKDLIAKICPEPEAKTETWEEVDSLVNYRFIKNIMDKLPEESHLEFMNLFAENPNDEGKIFGYLEEKVGKDIKEDLKNLLSDTSKELVHDLILNTETTNEVRSELEEKLSIR